MQKIVVESAEFETEAASTNTKMACLCSDRTRLAGSAAHAANSRRADVSESALVIGFGNTLRRDDGVGPRVARMLATTEGVAARVCFELVPELVDDLRGCAVAVFVDATTTLAPGFVASRPLRAAETEPASGLTHHFSPATLLLLAEKLYGARPRAFLVTVGAASFALGEELSPPVAAALPEAAAVVGRLIAANL